jgi:ABC-2 type transport system permease protein
VFSNKYSLKPLLGCKIARTCCLLALLGLGALKIACMYSIFSKELKSFFGTLTGYLIIGIFLTLTSLFLWIIPGEFNIPDNGYANVDGLFSMAPWLFLFLCPAISMRSISEEKQNGTWELLITKPITKWQLILGKYSANLVVVWAALLPTSFHFLVVSHLAEPVGNVDAGAFWGSMIGLLFLAAVFLAIGIYSSSVTNNQIVAFVMAIVISFALFYGFDLVSSFFKSGSTIELIQNLGIHAHYKSISRGVIDSRDLLYFIVSSWLFLLLAQLKISKY